MQSRARPAPWTRLVEMFRQATIAHTARIAELEVENGKWLVRMKTRVNTASPSLRPKLGQA